MKSMAKGGVNCDECVAERGSSSITEMYKMARLASPEFAQYNCVKTGSDTMRLVFVFENILARACACMLVYEINVYLFLILKLVDSSHYSFAVQM